MCCLETESIFTLIISLFYSRIYFLASQRWESCPEDVVKWQDQAPRFYPQRPPWVLLPGCSKQPPATFIKPWETQNAAPCFVSPKLRNEFCGFLLHTVGVTLSDLWGVTFACKNSHGYVVSYRNVLEGLCMADNEQAQVFQSLKGAYGVVFMLFKLGEFSRVVEYHFIYYLHWFEYCRTYKFQGEIRFSLGQIVWCAYIEKCIGYWEELRPFLQERKSCSKPAKPLFLMPYLTFCISAR